MPPRSGPTRGAYRDRHDTRTGMRWTRAALARRAVAGRLHAVSEGLARNDHAARARQNRAVLAPAAGVKSCGGAAGPTGPVSPAIRKATVATELGSPGRTRHKPSNHCAGKAGRFRLRLCFLCASLRIGSAQRPWVPAGTRSSLPPLHGEGERTSKARAEHAARTRSCVCNLKRALENSVCAFTPSLRGAKRRSNPDCRRGGILDCFAALAMTEKGPHAQVYHPHAEEAVERPSRSTRTTSGAFILRDARNRAPSG